MNFQKHAEYNVMNKTQCYIKLVVRCKKKKQKNKELVINLLAELTGDYVKVKKYILMLT